jgi:hypothetical protein
MVLVPAVMELLGKANWWLPRPLARLLPGRPGGPAAPATPVSPVAPVAQAAPAAPVAQRSGAGSSSRRGSETMSAPVPADRQSG